MYFPLIFATAVLIQINVIFGYITTSSCSSEDWDALNRTVGGRLFAATPLALPCFSEYNNRSTTPDLEACAHVQLNYTLAQFRVGNYASAIQPQWETCLNTRNQCLLDSTNPTIPLHPTGNCGQGSVSPYYITIKTPADVQAAFGFAKKTGVALSIKNTGHDYMGRSYKRDSLALWTHDLTLMTYSAMFTPQGCGGSFKAITAGVVFDNLYKFADANNVTFIGGYAETVGVSGGWLLGGGHSILTPVYGLGVDRVLQIKVITPDGQYRIANKCQNSDLFWALRGGGGGTFGVVIESSHLVESKLTFQTAAISFTPTTNNSREFFQIIVNNTVKWSNEGWGGHVTDGGMIYVNPKLSLEDATLSMKPVIDYAMIQGGTGTVETSPSWLSFFNKYVVNHQGPIGQILTLGTRLIPKSNFESDNGKTQLVDILMDLRATVINVATVTPILYNITSPKDTSVTPAWRNALWHLPQGVMWAYNASVPEIIGAQTFLHNFVDRFRALAPDSGAYLNEAEVYETDHEVAFWGPNYDRLLQIKARYDPKRLLDCWKCVGSKGPSVFPCYPPIST